MTRLFTFYGLVQGVGFRPFVAAQAEELGLSGYVKNTGGIVTALAHGADSAVIAFSQRLRARAPLGAVIERIEEAPGDWPRGLCGFSIVDSDNGGGALPTLTPDLPTCEACLTELQTPGNRRFGYPLISCASCGPRYSILEALPYDRPHLTMKAFKLCPQCEQDYQAGRRRHAQTLSCPGCGPQLRYCGGETGADALTAAEKDLQAGGVIAVKGVGGYQLCCSPYNREAVAALRALKHREEKPLAVLFPNLESIRRLCHVSEKEEALLASPARPIVLLTPKAALPFAENLSAESRFLGAFLPCSGLHALLCGQCGPLVCTSANLTDEPLCTTEDEAEKLGAPVLSHPRPILRPLDDSVAQVNAGDPQYIRRARGLVPLPIGLRTPLKAPVFCAGGDLKSVFCFAAGKKTVLSQPFGDVQNAASLDWYEREAGALQKLLGCRPAAFYADAHPGYFTARRAKELAGRGGLPFYTVQHHHAHILSVMAENGLTEAVGCAFDGTGFGADGGIWGGELLVCRGGAFQRRGHLRPCWLLGGDSAAKDAEKSALAFLDEQPFSAAAQKAGLGAFCTSMGRLFDAACFILGLGRYNQYEGLCAARLEQAAAKAAYAAPLILPLTQEDGLLVLEGGALLHAMRRARQKGTDVPALALGFHLAVAEGACAALTALCKEEGLTDVCLSGGVFVNRILTAAMVEKLCEKGLQPHLNRQTPPGDGGLALGQAYYAALTENTAQP
ncbi:MAG: carbamoyltransferase HypF [Oscillospiraceae bacterium]|nr:carbamoyltransferase HypF [Oscillospiraceae bacterium]